MVRKMLPDTYLLIYYNHQCREIKLQKLLSITDSVFQEHTSQIQDFFSTSVQFQDFSGPEKSKLKFQNFSGPVESLSHIYVNYRHRPEERLVDAVRTSPHKSRLGRLRYTPHRSHHLVHR